MFSHRTQIFTVDFLRNIFETVDVIFIKVYKKYW